MDILNLWNFETSELWNFETLKRSYFMKGNPPMVLWFGMLLHIRYGHQWFRFLLPGPPHRHIATLPLVRGSGAVSVFRPPEWLSDQCHTPFTMDRTWFTIDTPPTRDVRFHIPHWSHIQDFQESLRWIFRIFWRPSFPTFSKLAISKNIFPTIICFKWFVFLLTYFEYPGVSKGKNSWF